MARNHRFGVAVLALALCLTHSVAQGREASSIGGFSLNMSSDEIASIARSRLRLKVIHSDESLDLYNQGDDPDRSVPLAYFSYRRHGKIGGMHFQIDIFEVENVFTRDLLRVLQSLYGVERFRERKLLGYPVFWSHKIRRACFDLELKQGEAVMDHFLFS